MLEKFFKSWIGCFLIWFFWKVLAKIPVISLGVVLLVALIKWTWPWNLNLFPVIFWLSNVFWVNVYFLAGCLVLKVIHFILDEEERGDWFFNIWETIPLFMGSQKKWAELLDEAFGLDTEYWGE